MTTRFSALPIIDLGSLKPGGGLPRSDEATRLSEQLYDVFATTGFAYLVNVPLTASHEDVFRLARQFFNLPDEEKMRLAKKSFQPTNPNTYRGYFPPQPLVASDNLKEGFEMGPNLECTSSTSEGSKINLTEANVWPDPTIFPHRSDLEHLYKELQSLASTLLSLLAMSLGKPSTFFSDYLVDSVSTLRLLHYPCASYDVNNNSSLSLDSIVTSGSSGSTTNVKLSCTPHTDSGILTLLHQDSTGGLEVRNAAQDWIPAPYVPDSIVVNIGDLMAEVSGGRFVATMHRVRAPHEIRVKTATGGLTSDETEPVFGRFSVPFFFEPGETCVVRSVDDDGNGAGILYGEHVRQKMRTWVEFMDEEDEE